MSDTAPPPAPAAIRAVVEWYAAMGVDALIAEEPNNRFAAPPRRIEAPAAASPAPAAAPVMAGGTTPEEAERQAAAVAATAPTLEALRDALSRFEGCNLRLTATNLVFADGTPGSRVMLVGEAPGRDEDIQGVPFVGRSGQLLDRMLAAIGLDRKAVYIANVVPWRPPGNRTPTPQETASCRPFIRRQIELANPDFLICLGGAATHELFDTSEGILRLRGKWRTYETGTRTIRAMAMLHPAYLLRQPLHKRLAWRDLMALKAALDGAA